MIRALFRLVPWWVFAVAALNFAPVTQQRYLDYDADQTALRQALAAGPPDLIDVTQLDRLRADPPLGEVHINGTLRADLGVRSVFFAENEFTYVLLDGAQDGPLVALLIPADRAERQLTEIVNGSDSAGRVSVRGFLAPDKVGQVSRRLAISDGITRQIRVVEPYADARSDALTGRVSDSQTTFFGMLVLMAALIGATVIRWRQPRARKAAQTPAPEPAAAQRQMARSVSPAVAPAASSPWGATNPPPTLARAPKPTPPRPSKSAPQSAPKAEAEHTPRAEPAFKSVFPGGGSQFQFKSADQIIRQSFGTFRTIKRPPNRDDDADNATKADA